MSCWIRGCTTKSGKKDASKKKSLFTACTEKMFNNWRDSEIAARGINTFSKTSRICELHFQKDDIIKEDIFYMADGTTITVQRKIPKLKEDAVPSIFPSVIMYYNVLNPINKEKLKEQNEGTRITDQLKNTVNCFVSVPPCESKNHISHHEQNYTNEDNELQTWIEIKKNFKSLTLTSEYCIPVITDEMAMWTYWKEDLSSCMWRVILKKNMILWVYVGERQIDSLCGKIKNIGGIQNIFQKLSNVKPCKEVGNKTCSKLCVGYLIGDSTVYNVQCQRCLPCAKHYKDILKTSKMPTLQQKLSKNGQSLHVKGTYKKVSKMYKKEMRSGKCTGSGRCYMKITH
ncbi:uncharacterized protein LOC105839129 [Monomorium pharaonis]|uniref:uncharacterized protein LOC105839129 n=1 Tax=Monomorium pharaonis TaxID=307658 RepID=UPI00063F1C81|nr:uncharacterized protein LOC105839129 [Monomorium pharaonis]